MICLLGGWAFCTMYHTRLGAHNQHVLMRSTINIHNPALTLFRRNLPLCMRRY